MSKTSPTSLVTSNYIKAQCLKDNTQVELGGDQNQFWLGSKFCPIGMAPL